jgi:trigger factor
VKTSVEPLEGNKVKVSVEVDETEFEREIDAAFRRIAREVRIPGFRPGKAPRRILEARLGPDVGRDEALRHAIPDYYADAVREHDVDVIAQPEIDITAGEEGPGPVAFDAVVEVRPVVKVGGYDNLRVTIPSPEPTDADIDSQIDRLRSQFAELETVARPAADGDQVTIDIKGTQSGEPVPGLTADDYLYPVGSGSVVPELDDNLRGAKAGDILKFTAAHPDPEQESVSFQILVKEVKETVLPDADDAWAAEASEFDTVDELRADLRRRATMIRKVQAQMALREKASEALGELVTDELPVALIDSETQARLENMAMRLQAQGLDLETYLATSGQGPEELVAELREQATGAVRVDLALRAVVEAEGITVDDADVDREIDEMAARVDQKPDKVRKQLERNGQVSAIRSELRQRKALDWLLDHVEIVDEDGNPIDSDALVVEPEDTAAATSEDDTAAEQVDADAADGNATESDTTESEAVTDGTATTAEAAEE